MSDFQNQLDGARRVIPVDSRWLHKKGGRYEVIGHALDTDTLGVRIQYVRYDGPGYDVRAEAGVVWSRPIEEWSVDRFIQLP